MRYVKVPSSTKSLIADGQCQSLAGKFHRIMCLGDVKHSQTISIGLFIVMDTVVIFLGGGEIVFFV